MSERLSPELVLVSSPEEAARARAALPDRPWEAVLPSPPAASAAARLRPEPIRIPRPRPVAAPAAVAVQTRRRRRPSPSTVALTLVLAGLVAFVVVPAALTPADAPSLSSETLPAVTPPARTPPPSEARRSPPSPRPTIPVSAGRRAKPAPPASRPPSRPPTRPPSRPPTRPPSRPPTRPVAPPRPVLRAIADGGYVFASGRFLVSADRRRLTGFAADVRCAPGGELPPLRLSADGAYRLDATVRGVSAKVLVRFAGSRRAILVARFHRPGCDSGLVRRVAHLS